MSEYPTLFEAQCEYAPSTHVDSLTVVADPEDGEILITMNAPSGRMWLSRDEALKLAQALISNYGEAAEPEPDLEPTFRVGQPVIVTGSSAAMPHSLRVGYPATVVDLPDKDGDLFLRGVSAFNSERIIDQYVNVTDVRHVRPDEYPG